MDSVLSSLEDLHSINIIHRDIKPSNIMITKEHDIYLIDFGIARFYVDNADSDTTKLGTKGYAAPEQYGFQQSDFRTDIYSFGKAFDYLFKTNDIKAGLKRVISKASAFDPNDRYKTVVELKRAVKLRTYLPIIIACFIALVLIALCAIAVTMSNKNTSNNYDSIKDLEPVTEAATIDDSVITTLSLTETETSLFTSTTKANTTIKPTTKTTSTVKSTTKPATNTTSTAKPTTKTTTTTAKAPSTNQASVNSNAKASVNTNKRTTESNDVNILRIKNNNNYYSTVQLPDGTPFMEMLGVEKQKSCKIAINNTYVTVDCVRQDLTLNVSLKDELGHNENLHLSYTQEEFDDAIHSNSFNTYIYFIDYNNDGNVEIFVDYTDAVQWVYNGEKKSRIDGSPYVFYNYCKLMLLNHSAKNGFYLYRQIMTPGVECNVVINPSLYPGYIAIPEDSTMYKIENGTIVQGYM